MNSYHASRSPSSAAFAKPGKAGTTLFTLFAAALVMGLCVAKAPAQGSVQAPNAQTLARLDSLEHALSKRILGEGDKREIRACGRGKSEFLKRLRSGDSAYAGVDRDLNAAKLAGADPNQPSIVALMEKKFAFEKSFDDRYASTSEGKACIQGEAKRRRALAQALEKDKEYQTLLKKAARLGLPAADSI